MYWEPLQYRGIDGNWQYFTGLCSSKKYDFNSHHDCQWVDLPGIGSLTTFSFYDTNAMTDLYYAAGNICNKDPPLSCFAINPQQTLLTRHTTDEGFLDYLCEILPGTGKIICIIAKALMIFPSGNQTTTTTSTTTTTTTTSTSSSTTTTTQSTTASTASIQSLNGQSKFLSRFSSTAILQTRLLY